MIRCWMLLSQILCKLVVSISCFLQNDTYCVNKINYVCIAADKNVNMILSKKSLIIYGKAFDSVNHQMLLKRLNEYGIRGNAHESLKSCLGDRSHSVTNENAASTVRKMIIGVPQGPVLGRFCSIFSLTTYQTLQNLQLPCLPMPPS